MGTRPFRTRRLPAGGPRAATAREPDHDHVTLGEFSDEGAAVWKRNELAANNNNNNAVNIRTAPKWPIKVFAGDDSRGVRERCTPGNN
jgi:hypothetical protein